MSTLRINNIEAQSVPASPTIDEKVKVTNSSGDILVNIDGKTSGITTIGINTTDGNIKFDANSNVLITGILTATTLAGNFTPDSLEIGSNIKLGNAGVVTATSFVGSGANLTSLPAQATIANNADNRVITGGSGVNLNGESGLLFTGTNLGIGNRTSSPDQLLHVHTSSGDAVIHVEAGADPKLRLRAHSGESIIQFADASSSNTGEINYVHSGDYLKFRVNASERLRIDSSGRVLIGTTTEGSGGADELTIATTGDTGMTIRSGTSSAGGIYFSDGTSGGDEYRGVVSYNHASNFMRFYTDGTEKVRISSSGQLQISPAGAVKMSFYHDSGGSLNHITSNNGNEIKVSSGNGSTNGIEFWDYTGTDKRCQIDGQGIKFNNDTAQANGLNDYEEGSWTPSIISGASGISVSTATYTKVGRLVHVQCRYNSLSSPNGSQLKIGGLPYSAASVGHYTTAVMHDGWDFAGSQEPVPTVYQSANNPHFVFYYSRTAGQGWAAVSGSDTNGQGAIFSWCYHSA